MNFNSPAFLIFLPVVVAVTWLLPHRFRKYWLLGASWFFYAYWNPLLLLLLLASTVIDYCCGRGMERFPDRPGLKKTLLLCSVCMNLGLLFFFKYWDFFSETANTLLASLSLPPRMPMLHLLLPIGISFYTFQTMSYSIDVYRGDASAEKDFVIFALFVSFFPQLVAGPIESPSHLLPQLKAEHRPSWKDTAAGIRLMLCGFFRKCVIADYCGIYVNAVFSHAEHADASAVLFAGALFCIQMYCDFAGYSEIAMGSARLMGIRLMRNFDRPYLSQSYAEFFRRWHISLNRWFTNYVYIPLGGSRRGTVRRILNTLIVFSLCGLWHGARWTYVLWGLYAAFWVCLESVILKPAEAAAVRHGIDLKHPLVIFVRRVYMFLIFIPAAVLFRASSVSEAGILLSRLFTAGFSLPLSFSMMGLNGSSLVQLALVIAALICIHPWSAENLRPAEDPTESMRRMVGAAYCVLIIALCWLALLQSQEISGFAYFQF